MVEKQLNWSEIKIHRYINFINLALHNVYSLINMPLWDREHFELEKFKNDFDSSAYVNDFIDNFFSCMKISNPKIPASTYIELLIKIRNKSFHPEEPGSFNKLLKIIGDKKILSIFSLNNENSLNMIWIITIIFLYKDQANNFIQEIRGVNKNWQLTNYDNSLKIKKSNKNLQNDNKDSELFYFITFLELIRKNGLSKNKTATEKFEAICSVFPEIKNFQYCSEFSSFIKHFNPNDKLDIDYYELLIKSIMEVSNFYLKIKVLSQLNNFDLHLEYDDDLWICKFLYKEIQFSIILKSGISDLNKLPLCKFSYLIIKKYNKQIINIEQLNKYESSLYDSVQNNLVKEVIKILYIKKAIDWNQFEIIILKKLNLIFSIPECCINFKKFKIKKIRDKIFHFEYFDNDISKIFSQIFYLLTHEKNNEKYEKIIFDCYKKIINFKRSLPFTALNLY